MQTWKVFQCLTDGEYLAGAKFKNQKGLVVVFDGETLVGNPVGIEDRWECIEA